MPTKRRTKRRRKYKTNLSTIYEEKPSDTKRRSSPNRTLKKNNQPRLLTKNQRDDSIVKLAEKKAQEIQREDKQLGCFGRFCKNIKSKLTRADTRGGGLPKLSEKDHELIIQHYGKVLPKTKRAKKSKAERLVAQKLCSCIKKITKKSRKKSTRSRAIGICSYAVVKNRGMKHHGFTCSKRSKIKKLSKTRKIVYKRPYKPRKKKKTKKNQERKPKKPKK